jgi:hypothetical protein
MPAAGEDQPGSGLGIVKHRLGGPGGIIIISPGNQHGQHAITAIHRPLDYFPVIGSAGDDLDPVLVLVQFGNALGPADADDLIASFEAVLYYVPAQFSGRSYHTNFPGHDDRTSLYLMVTDLKIDR